MSTDHTAIVTPADVEALIRICQAICRQCQAGTIDTLPDEAATALLTAGTMLYTAAAYEQARPVQPFAGRDAVPATSVVVTTKAMLEAAGLSSFDLAMWSNRLPQAPPPEKD